MKIKPLYLLAIILTSASCTQNSSNSVAYESREIPASLQKEYDLEKAKIGKKFWGSSEHVRYWAFCETPDKWPACKSDLYDSSFVAKNDNFGPFTIRDVVVGFSASSSKTPYLFYKVITPEGGSSYLWVPDTKLHMLMEDPKITRVKAKAACTRKGGVSIGMTKAQVIASCWGKPQNINTTATANGIHEQWVYGGGYVYLDNGVVTAVQTEH
jgi:hypothetical protein